MIQKVYEECTVDVEAPTKQEAVRYALDHTDDWNWSFLEQVDGSAEIVSVEQVALSENAVKP